jgi:D-psicose/D-tagatose/L-ribulose 3-epimerase
MNPQLSFFGSAKDIDAISTAGYDCIEMQVNEIVKLGEKEFKDVCQRLQDSNIVCEVLDNPVPLDQVIADESFDLDFYQNYLQIGAERASQMGVKFYIFGNGKTRSLPTSGDIEKAKQKNLGFMRMLADITAKQDITILLEPLAPRVSNVIQSIAEAIEYANLVERPNIGTFLDYRWFLAMNHPFQDIEKYGQHIRHVHIDNPTTEFPKRLIPRINDGHDYSAIFQAMKQNNYNGIISIEANTFSDYEQDLRDGLAFFKYFGLVPRRFSTA